MHVTWTNNGWCLLISWFQDIAIIAVSGRSNHNTDIFFLIYRCLVVFLISQVTSLSFRNIHRTIFYPYLLPLSPLFYKYFTSIHEPWASLVNPLVHCQWNTLIGQLKHCTDVWYTAHAGSFYVVSVKTCWIFTLPPHIPTTLCCYRYSPVRLLLYTALNRYILEMVELALILS